MVPQGRGQPEGQTNAGGWPRNSLAKWRDRGDGPWSLGVRAGDFLSVAGMRGIGPMMNTLVEGADARVRQTFLNVRIVLALVGGGLRDAAAAREQSPGRALGRCTLFTRTIVEVSRLNQDDIVEAEGTFFWLNVTRTSNP